MGALPTPWSTTLASEFAGAGSGADTLGMLHQRGLAQFERYFAGSVPEDGLTVGAYRLAMALRDAGRDASARLGVGRTSRLEYTGRFLDHVREQLPLEEDAFRRLKALVTVDPLGPFFKDGGGANVERVVRELETAAEAADMNPLAFLRAITPIYQADIAARTLDAGIPRARFDNLFELRNGSALTFDAGTGRLRFNAALEPLWGELEAALETRVPRAVSGPPPVLNAEGAGAAVSQLPEARASALSYVSEEPRELLVSRELARLSPTQLSIVNRFTENAARMSSDAYPELLQQAQRLGYTAADVDRVLDAFRNEALVNVHFDPTLRVGQGRTLAQAFREDGRYRTQFETGQTSASMNATRRAQKEEGLFGYPMQLNPMERPIYGTPNVEGAEVTGVAKFYGDSHLVLGPNVKPRTSLTHRNSKNATFNELGTSEDMAHLLVNLIRPGDDLNGRTAYFRRIFDSVLGRPVGGDNPFRYFEGQVHGPVEFQSELAAVHAADIHRGTNVETELRALADTYNVPLRWIYEGKLFDA